MPATIAESVIASSSFAITFTGLANSSVNMAVSTPIFPSTTPLDELITIAVPVTTTAPANDQAVYVWAYGSIDGTTGRFTDGITGNSTAFTRTDPPNLRLVGVVNISTAPSAANQIQVNAGPWSLAAAFGGVLPRIYGVCVQNFSGNALATSSAAVWHSAIYGQST